MKRQSLAGVATLFGAVAAVLFVGIVACRRQTVEKPVRSMYYWRTVFSLSRQEADFLKNHHVERLYVRYFDVVMNEQGEPMPNATIKFPTEKGMQETLAGWRGDIVPTVFITNDCMAREHDGLAGKIVERVIQMCETHDVKSVKELQIDCDWTISTRRRFFDFLSELRTKARAEGMGLSATIRLHQLSQPVPPADRGVLMVYNTGDVTQLDCHHPILDLGDVRQYLPRLRNYDLPLSAAYPLFTWKVLFRQDRYVGIMHGDDDLPVIEGDSIAIRQPDMAHIVEAREAIGRLCPEIHNEVILYDLSKQNITLFKQNDYETIFGH